MKVKKILVGLSLLLGSFCILLPMVQAQNVDRQISEAVSTVVSDKTGWPIELSDGYVSDHATTGNLDADADLEIIYLANLLDSYRIYAYNADGTAISGFPVDVAGDGIQFLMAVDINNDGYDEISGVDNANPNVNIYFYNHDGSLYAQWSIAASGNLSDAMIGDVNNDGNYEYFLSRDDGVYLFDNTGNVMTGWPYLTGYYTEKMTLADLDGNGDKELVFINSSSDQAMALNYDGTAETGWPVAVPNIIDNRILSADFDNDERDEVVVTARFSSDSHDPGYLNHKVYLIDNDGSIMPNWPVDNGSDGIERMSINDYTSLLAGDIDGDGNGELIANVYLESRGYSHTLMAWETDGSIVSGFPVDLVSGGSLYLVDLNYDGKQEIITDTGYAVYVYNELGEPLVDYSFMVSPDSTLSGLIFTDLESDGFIDVISPKNNRVEMYTYNQGVADFFGQWTQTGGNKFNTQNVDLSMMYDPGETDSAGADAVNIGDITETENGEVIINNENGEELYSCAIFDSGKVNAALGEFDGRYYLFAAQEEGKTLAVVNPINCEILQEVSLSKKDKMNQFILANVYKKSDVLELVTASPVGKSVKTTVYFMKDGLLVKKARKTVDVGSADWTLSVKKKIIRYKVHKTIIKELKLVKKTKFKLQEL